MAKKTGCILEAVVANRRKKPNVAILAQASAKLNIESKLKLLELWVCDGTSKDLNSKKASSKVVSINTVADTQAFPRSLRQFNQWQVDEETCVKFGLKIFPLKTNSNDTLGKYTGIKDRIQHAIKSLVVMAQQTQFDASASGNKLRRRLKLFGIQKSTLEQELLKVRAMYQKAEERRRIAEDRLLNLKEDFQNEIEKYEKQMLESIGSRKKKASIVTIVKVEVPTDGVKDG